MTFASPFSRVIQRPFGGVPSIAPAGGWWDLDGALSGCVAAYQPIGAADYAASKVNLANPGTYDAANGAAYPTWDDVNGWKFASANSQYLTTGITPGSDWSVLIRVSNLGDPNLGGIGYWLCGSYPSSGLGFGFYVSGDCFWMNGSNTTSTFFTSGIFGIAGVNCYYNGGDIGSDTNAGGAPDAIYIGDTAGAYRRYLEGYVQAFSIYNVTRSATEMDDITTAMAAL